MTTSVTPPTSLTLLAKMQSQQVQADDWRRFLQVYTPAILDWCRSYRLQEADSRDMTQEVLLRISRCLAEFEYDPSKSFRGWLRTVLHRCWCDWLKSTELGGTGSGDTAILRLLAEIPAREDLARRLDEQYDRELLGIAMEQIRARVTPQTWQAFELLAMRHMPGNEAARHTGMNVASAFAARSKVQRLVREEVERLRARDGWS
jgi:RNA polymerase sigma-70 factor (ECF subfamily)